MTRQVGPAALSWPLALLGSREPLLLLSRKEDGAPGLPGALSVTQSVKSESWLPFVTRMISTPSLFGKRLCVHMHKCVCACAHARVFSSMVFSISSFLLLSSGSVSTMLQTLFLWVPACGVHLHEPFQGVFTYLSVVDQGLPSRLPFSLPVRKLFWALDEVRGCHVAGRRAEC